MLERWTQKNPKLLRTTEIFLETFLLPLSHVAVVSAVIGKRKLSKFSLLILLIYDFEEESRVKRTWRFYTLYFMTSRFIFHELNDSF